MLVSYCTYTFRGLNKMDPLMTTIAPPSGAEFGSTDSRKYYHSLFLINNIAFLGETTMKSYHRNAQLDFLLLQYTPFRSGRFPMIGGMPLVNPSSIH